MLQPALPVAPNVLDRRFETDAQPSQGRHGEVALAVLLDLFGRRVDGWATSASNDRALALAALR